MHGCGDLSGQISVARVHRRLHQRADGMVWIPANVGGASPRVTGSSSRASPRRRLFVAGRAPGAVGRRAGANAAGSVPPNGRRSLDGACSSSAACSKRIRARADAARRGARPDDPPEPPACGGDWGGASGLPAGARRLGVGANNYSPLQELMRSASGRRRGCAWSRCAGRPCVRTPG